MYQVTKNYQVWENEPQFGTIDETETFNEHTIAPDIIDQVFDMGWYNNSGLYFVEDEVSGEKVEVKASDYIDHDKMVIYINRCPAGSKILLEKLKGFIL